MAKEVDRLCKEYFDQLDRFSDLVNYALYRMHKVLYEHVNDNNFDNEMIEKIIKETLEYFKK